MRKKSGPKPLEDRDQIRRNTTVRLTVPELEVLRRVAREQRITVSEAIRLALFGS